jgi:hypothetical protein
MLDGTGKCEIALAEEQRLVKVLRSLDVVDMARTGYRDLVLGRVTPDFYYSLVERRGCFFSTFLRRHGEEGCGFLVNVYAATLRTLDLTLFVFVEREDDFKWLLAIFTVELIARHMDLRRTPGRVGFYTPLYARATLVSRPWRPARPAR